MPRSWWDRVGIPARASNAAAPEEGEVAMIRCSPENVRFVCNGLDHPEGICFAADGSLIAGSESGLIYRVEPSSGRVWTVADTGGFVLGLCADQSRAVYACDAGRNEVVRIGPDGAVQAVSSGSLDNPNDCAFDAEGNLFFSESGIYHPERHTGRLFVIDRGGKTACVHPGPFRFANGIFVDCDEQLLYVVESTAPSVVAFRIDGPTIPSPAPVRRVELEPGTVPDGVALDTEGNIYVAFYVPDQIGVIRPDGSFEVLYRDFLAEWMNRPTNIALQRNEIYFANLGGWHIGAVQYPLTPLPPFLPESGPPLRSGAS